MYFIDYSSSLSHHGVKGMKWGVRNEERRLGSASRITAKKNYIQGKIKKSDNNVIARNTINNFRRGRVAGLAKKEAHRSAKEAYKKNKSYANKQRLKVARSNRLVYNVGSKAIGISTMQRGEYNKNRSAGQTKTNAALITAGKSVAIGLAAGVVLGSAQNYINNQMVDGLVEDTLRRYK